MNKEYVVYTHNGILYINAEELNFIIRSEMNRTGRHPVKRNNPDGKKCITCFLSYMKI